MTIKVLLVDDHPAIISGLRAILQQEPDIDVVGEARDGMEAVNLTQQLRPDVVVMDIRMDVMDGLEATSRIMENQQGEHQVNLLIFTSFPEDQYIYRAWELGASGFVEKDRPPEVIIHAVREVAKGESLLYPSETREIIRKYAQRNAVSPEERVLGELTEREREVFHLVAQTLSNEEIAEQLVIQKSTVRDHTNNIYGKLGLHSREQLVSFAFKNGLIG